jgi:hypothetical protein
VLLPATLLGLAAGVGFWVTPVCLPLTAASVTWIAVRRLLRPRAALPRAKALQPVLSFGSGAALGALPWIVWNARHGWASLAAPEAGHVGVAGFFANAWGFVTVSLPILAGATRPHHVPGTPGVAYPGAAIVAPLALLLLVAPALARLRRDPRVALLVLTLAAVTGAALLSSRFTPDEPRYFMAAYVLVPPLLGAAAAWWLAVRRRARVALAAAAVLLATHVAGYASAYAHGPVVEDSQVTGPLDGLVAALKRLGVDRAWGSYWTTYRLAFETGEQILASPLGAEDVVRIPRYAAEVKVSPRAAVVLLPPRTDCFAAWLDERGVPAVRTRAGAFTIFSSLPTGILATIAAGESLPLAESAERVSWRLRSAGRAPDGAVTVDADLRNGGPCVFTHAVTIVASSAPPGGSWSDDVDTHLPNARVAPGESVRVLVKVPAPAPGGRVRLRLRHRATGLFPEDGAALVTGGDAPPVSP